MPNPTPQITTAATRFHVYYASEDETIEGRDTVWQWLKQFEPVLKAWYRQELDLKPHDLAGSGAAGTATGRVEAGAEAFRLRDVADGVVVLYTPEFRGLPRPALVTLVSELMESTDPPPQPQLWVLKLDLAPFDNTDIGRAPLWHELKPDDETSPRYHFPGERGWNVKDEMAQAAQAIARHSSCDLPLACCPRHAHASPAPAPLPEPRGNWFSRLFAR